MEMAVTSSVDDDPSDSDMSSRFVRAGTAHLVVKRGGHNIIRSARIPKPMVLVDTREKQPFALYANPPTGSVASGDAN